MAQFDPDHSESRNDAIRNLMASTAPDELLNGMLTIISLDEICNRIDELLAFEPIANRPETLHGFLHSLAQVDSLSRSQRLVLARVAFINRPATSLGNCWQSSRSDSCSESCNGPDVITVAVSMASDRIVIFLN